MFYGFETNLSPFLLIFLAARALTNSGFAATTSRMFTKLVKVIFTIFILFHCQASSISLLQGSVGDSLIR